MPTTTAEQEARGAIGLFRTFFGRVKNLTPSIFLTREDEDWTGKIYRNPRPANVCHSGVKARNLDETVGRRIR